jgi:hypothetical protein
MEKTLFGNGDVFIKLGFHVDSERVRDQTKSIVKVGGVYELQYGPEQLGWQTWCQHVRQGTCTRRLAVNSMEF